MDFKYLNSIGRYNILCILLKKINKNKKLYLLHTVQGTVIYKTHIKFELNRKYRLDSSGI